MPRLAAEAIASTLGREALYWPPSALPPAAGLACRVIVSAGDAVVEAGPARLGRQAVRLRVYGDALVLKQGGRIEVDGRRYALVSDGEAADRGRQSWHVSVRDEGAVP